MTHGGRRTGAGRPPRAGERATSNHTVWLTDGERGELESALRPDETLSDLLREGGLAEARRRAKERP